MSMECEKGKKYKLTLKDGSIYTAIIEGRKDDLLWFYDKNKIHTAVNVNEIVRINEIVESGELIVSKKRDDSNGTDA